jgi:hypothetical protein
LDGLPSSSIPLGALDAAELPVALSHEVFVPYFPEVFEHLLIPTKVKTGDHEKADKGC